jgi:hypothetical protein
VARSTRTSTGPGADRQVPINSPARAYHSVPIRPVSGQAIARSLRHRPFIIFCASMNSGKQESEIS